MFLYKSLKQRDEEEDVQVGLAVSWLWLSLAEGAPAGVWFLGSAGGAAAAAWLTGVRWQRLVLLEPELVLILGGIKELIGGCAVEHSGPGPPVESS